jgi:hypothetical protein
MRGQNRIGIRQFNRVSHGCFYLHRLATVTAGAGGRGALLGGAFRAGEGKSDRGRQETETE